MVDQNVVHTHLLIIEKVDQVVLVDRHLVTQVVVKVVTLQVVLVVEMVLQLEEQLEGVFNLVKLVEQRLMVVLLQLVSLN